MDFNAMKLMWLLVPVSALAAVLVAFILYRKMLVAPEGNERMQQIAQYVKDGANAYLKRQYTTVAIVFGVIFVILSILAFMGIQNPFVPFVFLSGGFLSGLSGYLGMKTATNCSARTAAACQTSLNAGLKISFRGGAVMGLLVVGFGLLGISFWLALLNFVFNHNLFGICDVMLTELGLSTWDASIVDSAIFQKAKYIEMTNVLLTFAMGASAMALFARVGGGIFTKAADVGADLVGKVEAGIPEDDPRNPATIADNVGDNVGDVAGMGADLYESYCGSILAVAALGVSMAITQEDSVRMMLAPLLVAAVGIISSLIGIFMVRTTEEASQKVLLRALLIGTSAASVLTFFFLIAMVMLHVISWGVLGAIVAGLLAGIIIGQATEYYTSSDYRPTQRIAEYSSDGEASNILQGFSTGMLSAGIPVIVVSIAILAAFVSAGGLKSLGMGIYGIGIAAIGMLSTLGIQLATDAFGPIADNAGGNAAMAGLPPEVRERTDALDALGNTTAATGKGFAIGSAALTALALIAAYLDSLKAALSKLAGTDVFMIGTMAFTNFADKVTGDNVIDIRTLDAGALVSLLQINVLNPKFLVGLFLGSMLVFVFCALTINAVGNAASQMVREVRRQFKEIVGIMDGTGTPDYARCVDISTVGAQKAMLLPSLIAITAPIVTGLFLHVAGVMGLLTGSVVTGFSLAIVLNNSGGAWDNAKKYVESGKCGGKGTPAHRAAVTGDTVGDPFKDTAGPSLNILIKLMSIVSVVFAGVILKFGLVF